MVCGQLHGPLHAVTLSCCLLEPGYSQRGQVPEEFGLAEFRVWGLGFRV